MMAVIRVILYLASVGFLVASGYRHDFHGTSIIGLGILFLIFLLERFVA